MSAVPANEKPRRSSGVFVAVDGLNWDDPDGIRTRVAALKGPCPRPLDDGAIYAGTVSGCLGEPNTMQM